MNILDWQKKGRELLACTRPMAFVQGTNSETISREVDNIISGILGVSMLELYLKGDQIMDNLTDNCIEQAFQKRLSGTPLQYILGETEFFSMPFYVTPGVFIPRPETECLVDEALKIPISAPSTNLLDLCTGCGSIALSLAKNTPYDIIATDISAIALEVAAENARRLNLSDRVKFFKGDLFEPLKNGVLPHFSFFSIIVSNPPYIKRDELDSLPDEVKYYEPGEALDGGIDGLDFYKRICDEARYFIKKGGYLLLELGPADEVASLLKDHGWQDIIIIKDYKNYERVIIARWTK
jgi:release factor glutamine methyltransferase